MRERERDPREFMPRDREPREAERHPRDVDPGSADRPAMTQPTTADMAASPARSTKDVRDAARDPRARDDQDHAALFPQQELNDLRSKWSGIQGGFVDEPRKSVEEADGLVAATIQRLAESFADARANLEGQWQRGGDVSTEDLRMALRRYRSFFDRLLAVGTPGTPVS